MITEDAATTLLADLVRVESVTPWLIPTGSGERAIAEAMAAWVEDLPVDTAIEEIEPGRVNLLVTLKGSGGGPSR
jgi:acetylornithine deacetylase